MGLGLGHLEPERETALGLPEHATHVVALDVLAVGRAGVLLVAAARLGRPAQRLGRAWLGLGLGLGLALALALTLTLTLTMTLTFDPDPDPY